MVGHVATRPLVLTLTTPSTTTSTLGALTPTRSRSRRISATPLSVIAEYATAEVRSHLRLDTWCVHGRSPSPAARLAVHHTESPSRSFCIECYAS
jgi:hypothetical protein